MTTEGVHAECEETWVFVCLLYADGVEILMRLGSAPCSCMGMASLTAVKSVLVWCAGMIGYLYAAFLLHGIVVQVDIASFVEAVVRGCVGRRREVVVNVGEAAQTSVTMRSEAVRIPHSVKRDTSPCCGGMSRLERASHPVRDSHSITKGAEDADGCARNAVRGKLYTGKQLWIAMPADSQRPGWIYFDRALRALCRGVSGNARPEA